MEISPSKLQAFIISIALLLFYLGITKYMNYVQIFLICVGLCHHTFYCHVFAPFMSDYDLCPVKSIKCAPEILENVPEKYRN